MTDYWKDCQGGESVFMASLKCPMKSLAGQQTFSVPSVTSLSDTSTVSSTVSSTFHMGLHTHTSIPSSSWSLGSGCNTVSASGSSFAAAGVATHTPVRYPPPSQSGSVYLPPFTSTVAYAPPPTYNVSLPQQPSGHSRTLLGVQNPWIHSYTPVSQ